MKRRKRRRGGDGCGYLVWVCLLTCFLLVVNAIVVRAIYVWYLPAAPPLVAHERFGRAILFIGPFLLLIVQWALIDRVIDFFAKSPGEKRQP